MFMDVCGLSWQKPEMSNGQKMSEFVGEKLEMSKKQGKR